MDKKLCMLIIEDNEINRESLKKICQDKYEILVAENNKTAIDIIENSRIDIILLEHNITNFIDIIKLIRSKESIHSDIPIVIVSRNNDELDKSILIDLGIDDFICVPYDKILIKKRLENLSKKYKSEQQLKLTSDVLTGLPGSNLFYINVKQLLTDSPDIDYSLLVWDIKHFKVTNDLFGSKISDDILIQIASDLDNEIGELGPLCRLSNDHFAACIPTKKLTIGWINSFSKRPVKINKMLLNIRFGLGIYHITDKLLPVSEMCDCALLAAKSIVNDYNTNYAYYNDNFLSVALKEQWLMNELYNALVEDSLNVFYQPCYNPQNGKIIAAEALVRWEHPQYGVVMPNEFIPILERNGVISTLDRYVWRKVCSDIRTRKEKGLPSVTISINISRYDIYNPSTIDDICEILKEFDVSPTNIALEITEYAYLHMMDECPETLSRLKKLGFILEMDNFGSDNLSLSVIKNMPIDVLKMDVTQITKSDPYMRGNNILKAIFQMTRSMCMNIIAVGIENEEQLAFLKLIGCEGIQGYFYSKAIPEIQFEKILSSLYKNNLQDDSESVSENKPQMLLIHNDEETILNIKDLFSNDFNIIEKHNGEDGLTTLRTTKVDIIISDINLTEMTGFELLSNAKEDNELSCIPFVILTSTSLNDEEKALNLGADEFINSTNKPTIIKKRIENTLNLFNNSSDKLTTELNQLRQRSEYDELTEIYNRRTVEELISTGLKNSSVISSVMLIDFDNFKDLNENYGKQKCDIILKDLSSYIKNKVRKTDVVGRIGGDKIIVFLYDVKEKDIIEQKLKDFCEYASSLSKNLSDDANVSVSIGAAISNCEKITFSQISARAEEALYQAKTSGKNCYNLK